MPDPFSVLLWGRPKTHKSTLALSFPDPLHVFDFDFGINELTDPGDVLPPPKWADLAPKVIQRRYTPVTGGAERVIYLHPMRMPKLQLTPSLETKKALLQEWQTLFIRMLAQEIPTQTIVIDTDSQWWNMARPVKAEEARLFRENQMKRRNPSYYAEPSRLDNGLANEYRETTILECKAAGINLILIERAKELWGVNEDGRNPQPTGEWAPRGQTDTDALVNLVLRNEETKIAGKDAVQTVVEISRLRRIPKGLAIPGLTYETLAQMAWPEAKKEKVRA